MLSAPSARPPSCRSQTRGACCRARSATTRWRSRSRSACRFSWPPNGACSKRTAPVRQAARRAGAAGRASSAARPLRVWPTACILHAATKPSKKRCRPSVMTPRNVGLRADDAVASHRAVGGAGHSIKRARTCARGISRGAVAVLRAHRPRLRHFVEPASIVFFRPRPPTDQCHCQCFPCFP